MILILSENNDLSTTQVIEWLELTGEKWIRINHEDDIRFEYIGEDVIFILEEIKFHLSDIKAFWYRRGFFNIEKNKSVNIVLNNYLNEELKDLYQFIYYKLKNIKHLDSINNYSINKLIVNDIAKKIGLKVPNDFIFSNKKKLESFLEHQTDTYITKSIAGQGMLIFEDFIIKNYTTKIDYKKNNSPAFFPSLLQNYIDKKYELRIYYFRGECFSMAIFSQNDETTSVDFRNYNHFKSNRRVPFKLPYDIEYKLKLLMESLQLDTGSIDMIVTPDMDYIFLEVNPVGQFGMTSFPCNYNIEKKIANYLSYEN